MPILAGLLVVAACSAAPAAARGAEVEVENFRVGFVGESSGNVFKIGSWVPVAVQLKGTSDRFSGVLEIEVPDDDGTPTYFRQVIDVPAGSSTRVVTYARPGSRDPNFLIRIFDERGRRRGPVVDGSRLVQLGPVMPDETLLLMLGKASGVEQVAKLPGFSTDKNATGQELMVARVEDPAGLLPGRWYGYDAAKTIVVDTNDKDVMAALAVRGQALIDWVARGGHLVVAVGSNWQSVRDSPLGPILPCVPTGQERLTSLATLETFAGATKPITPAGSPAVFVTKLDEVESRGGKVLSATADIPLVVRGTYEFGRVTVVALDVDQKPFADWPDRALFWVKAIDLRRSSSENVPTSAAVRIGGGGRRLYQTGVSDLATQLRAALEQFPGVKLIPFGWVAFFIFIYILLIGPGDYLFLKKVLKRMELTWVTFPLIVVTVSLVAYFAAYMVKGRELRVNKVDVVDVDQTSGHARGSSFINLFSPQNRDYDVTVSPLPLDRPASRKEAGSITPAGRPPAGTEVLVTWLGVPEVGFGGMGNSGRMGFGGGGYASQPMGGSEKLAGVRIPIWSTKLISGRWFGPAPKLIESDLAPAGTDRLAGTVTNRLDVPLENTIVAIGKHVYELGSVAPGQTVRVELSQDRQLSGRLKARSSQYQPSADMNASGNLIDRTELLLALMFHDSQGTVGSDRPMASNTLSYLDLTGQLALDRPMLVARIDRPAATVVLENAATPPKVSQTTMLRVILPLNKGGESGKSK